LADEIVNCSEVKKMFWKPWLLHKIGDNNGSACNISYTSLPAATGGAARIAPITASVANGKNRHL